MPWFGVIKHPFTRRDIELFAPAKPGVYALWNGQQWIYVGEANNLRQRLLEHVGVPGTCLSSHTPTAFGVELHDAQQIAARRDELIAEFRPACNQAVG